MHGPIRNSLSLLIVLLALGLSACAGQQLRNKSSVVDYLYPEQAKTEIQPSVPVLSLPLKVGIAFVPEQRPQSRGGNLWTGGTLSSRLSELDKSKLLEKVAAHFRRYEFVDEIEVIPSPYLRPAGSFANLDQIQTMYGIDVIALVSFDQVQFTDEGLLSMTYWTLVGAYVFSGEKNDTSTLLDTAVYDIKSRKLLFRAPGTNTAKGSATLVNLSEQLRRDSLKSFEAATEEMIKNLDLELGRFKEKIKHSPEKAKIITRQGYRGGGGSMGGLELSLILLATAVCRRGFCEDS